MGTEVLRPQDLLVERFHVPPAQFHRRRYFPASPNLPHNNRKTSPKPEKKKINAAADTRKSNHGGVSAEARRKNDGPVMGQITLLRRGESLDSLTTIKSKGGNTKQKSPKAKPVDDLAVLGIGRIGPAPEMVPKQIRMSPPPLPNNYAGSAAFSMSPSPQSLPLPSFFSKKQQQQIDSSSNDPATRDLRRMLRLD